MKESTVIFAGLALVVAVASFGIGCLVTQSRYEKAFGKADTVYVERWIRDTIREPKDSIIYKWRTAYLTVHDTSEVHDTTTITDSVLVDVPIWEKSYVSQNYSLTIRGFEPELVDIWIRQKETLVKAPYRKPWSLTIGPQVGFGITPKGWQSYAGAGVTFGYSF